MIYTNSISDITGAKVLVPGPVAAVRHLLIDSRTIINPSESLFFSIKGVRHDGHHYLETLYNKGVRNFIVETTEHLTLSHFLGANIWLADSSVDALQKIAAFHRSQVDLPVIAVTGSNGKTIVKEWLSQLLQKKFHLAKNPKSYNSQVGVPLSVWGIHEYHTLGIFEAGISLPSEMERLAKIIQPTLGILTNIGTAHDEGFSNSIEKCKEKFRLFEKIDLVFYRKGNPIVDPLIEALSCNSFSWSSEGEATVQALSTNKGTRHTAVRILYASSTTTLHFPFTDDASIENLMHCVCVLLYFDVSIHEIQDRINALNPVRMRMELKEGINNSYLIDDAYNNDFAGLSMAINFLDQQKQRTQKTIILSDLLESGSDSESLYKDIAHLCLEKNCTKFIGIGPTLSLHQGLFQKVPQSSFFESTEGFLESMPPASFSNELILIKGARVFSFERIVRMLQQKIHGTVLEINLDALAHNLNYYRSCLRPTTKIMAMVKAFAYGSGSFEVANLLQYQRTDYLAVAYADEGVALRTHGIVLPIMVMNPSPQSFETLIHYQLEPELYSFSLLNAFIHFLSEKPKPVAIHLKVDTGMHRLGFIEQEIPALISLLLQHPSIRVASIFTHLAAADEAVHNDYTKHQLASFTSIAQQIEQALGYSPLKHALNSAGIVRFPDFQMDMVRLGIGLYGVEAGGLKQSELLHVGTLKTTISQLKKVAKGDSVGYSRKGIAEKDTTVATIAIGYADGYHRANGNGVGEVMIKGKRCPIIGNVCMDMCMVDVTGVNAEEGDEVLLFGEEPTILEQAKKIGTIPYEILTSIGERVKRVFYTE